MKPFDIAEALLEQHARGMPLPELKKAFENALQQLGMRHFACCSHVDPLNPRNAGLVFQTYPGDWVRYFSESGRYRVDPVFRYADERMVPFSWDDPTFRAGLTPLQLGILDEAEGRGAESTRDDHEFPGRPVKAGLGQAAGQRNFMAHANYARRHGGIRQETHAGQQQDCAARRRGSDAGGIERGRSLAAGPHGRSQGSI